MTTGRSSLFRVLGFSLLLILLGLLLIVRLDWKDQLALGVSLYLAALWLNRRSKSHTITLALSLLSVFCTLRYGYWRVGATYTHIRANGIGDLGWDIFFVALLLGAEAYAIMILVLGYFQTARPLQRQPMAMPDAPETWPTVDVFIPTYNEPLDVVRATVFAAQNIDYPADRYQVYILDDGSRAEFQEFAAACGVGYITRIEHKHAKAGNINHALGKTKGEYVIVFDCDHIPTRSYLQVSMGWFLKDERLGMVQTPHHFYSPDPFERNLGIFRDVPNEGALFYGMVQDGNDFWNATFFCGSCAVLRRSALEQIGGIAVETVTEDAHTALRLQRLRWNTAYLSVRQAAGLATNTVAEHIQQRIRWARGMVQILRVECPLFASGLRLPQRLCYFNSVVHFLYAVPRLVFLTAPLVYLLFGRSNLYGDVITILTYAFPHLALATLTNSRVQGKFRHSFWNEVYETVLAPYILLPTTFALINPKWGKFNVTPKSGRVEQAYLDWKIASPFLFLVVLNMVGIGMGVSRLMAEPDKLGTICINVFWAACNTLTLGAALAVAYEKRQLRACARIKAQMPAALSIAGGANFNGRTVDLSNGGVSLQLDQAGTVQAGEDAWVGISLADEVALFPAVVVEARQHTVRLAFESLTLQQQESLARVIYSRADCWLDWNDSTSIDRPFRAFRQIVGFSLQGIARVVKELLTRRDPEPHPGPARQQPALPLFIIGGLLLFLFAWRASAAPAPQSHAVPKPEAVRAEPAASFHDVADLRSFGQKQPLLLRGADGRATMSFGLPLTKIVEEASLQLLYRPAASLQSDASSLQVSLNGSAVASIPLQRPAPGQPAAIAQIPLPADLLVTENTLVFQLSGRCEGGCPTGESDAEFRTFLDLNSQLRLSGSLLPLANELRLLPAPFFDASARRVTELPFVFAAEPDAPALEAAGAVASWFGLLADHRGIRFSVSVGQIPPGNVVLFAQPGSTLIADLQLPTSGGPAVAVRDNPRDRFGKVLIILGRDSQQLLTAARTLALGRVPKSGDFAALTDSDLPPVSQPYSAPRWLKGDRTVTFGDQLSQEQLRVAGTGEVKLYFRLPPDLFFGSQATVPLRLNYRYTGLPRGSKAQMTVKLNGFTVASQAVSAAQASAIQRETIQLPVPTLYPRNTLSVDFAYERGTGTLSTAEAHNPEGVVLRDSELDLRGITNFTIMPKLQLFAKAGYPFTRLPDLSGTAVVLPVTRTPEQIGLYLGALGFLGAQTGYPAIRVSVVNPDQALSMTDKELLVIGAYDDQPLFSRWAERLPIRVERSELRLNAGSGLFQSLLNRVWMPRGDDRRRLGDMLATEPIEAMVQGFGSPVGAGHSAIALISASPRNVDALNTLLEQSLSNEDVFGTVSVYQGGRYQSFRLGTENYQVGHLGWRDALDYWVAHYLWFVPIAILLILAVLASHLRRWLDRRAELRLEMQV